MTLQAMTVEEVMLRGKGTQEPRRLVLPPAPDGWTLEGKRTTTAPPALAVCIPFEGRYVPPEFAIALALLQFPPNTQYMLAATKGIPRDEARNDLVRQAMAAGARYILFLDDDNPPPVDAVLKLMYVLDSTGPEVALVGGIYTNKYDPPSPLVFMAEGAGPYWKWKAGEVFECPGGVATGCMMIRAATFARVPEPWFVDSPEMTDDMHFCRKVHAAGMTMLAHGGVLPAHWGQDGKEYRIGPDTYPFQGGE